MCINNQVTVSRHKFATRLDRMGEVIKKIRRTIENIY